MKSVRMVEASDNRSRPLRCLWVTRQDPRAANSGELIYSAGLLRALAATGEAVVTVVAHAGRGDAGSADRGIRWDCEGDIPRGRARSVLSRLPSDAFRLGSRSRRDALRRWMREERWDWLVIDQAASAWALDLCPCGLPGPRVAYLAHNHEAPLRRQIARDHRGSLPLRLALRWDSLKYARMEARLCRRADLITAITPRDQRQFLELYPGKPVVSLPPGYGGLVPEGGPPPITAGTPRKVVLAGAFEWIAKRANLEGFLTASEQLFRARGIGFRVVGKADSAYFGMLAERHPWARFEANVPSIEPFLAEARVGLIPEALGGGFKLKALDYIFRGLPLAAIRDALSGLPVEPCRDAICAESPEELAAAVAGRIDDLAFLNSAATRAFEACRDAFHWEDRGVELARALNRPLLP